MIVAVLLLAQSKPPIPAGSQILKIGKLVPGIYTANRATDALPKVTSLSERQRKSFTGIIWRAREIVRPAEFERGKRIMPKAMGPYAGQTVDAYLKMVGPKADMRYSTKTITGFEVTLPGDEKKLASFAGFLSSRKVIVEIKAGKVVSSSYARRDMKEH